MKNGQSRLQKQVNMFFVRNHPRYLLNLQKKWLILVLITKSEYWKVLCLGFTHNIKKVKNLINDHSIGKSFLFNGNFGFPTFPKGNIRYDLKLGGGFLNDCGCYPICASRINF